MRRFALAPQASVWIAEAGPDLAGFVIVEANHGAGYVVTLDVAPEHRRAGIAAELMRLAQESLARQGMRTLGLHVFAGNADAIRFYEQSGFRLLATEAGFYGLGLDALVYGRELDPAPGHGGLTPGA